MQLKIAFPTDEHYPYQDEHARAIALQIVKDFNPDQIISGSDGLDFYTVSRFDKDPARVKGANLQRDIDEWLKGQKEWMDAAPNAIRRYILGNHEQRLEKYFRKHAELSELDALQYHNLLHFEEIGIENGVEDELVFGELLVIKHGEVVRQYSAYSAKGEMEKERYSISTMTGHTHRGGTSFAMTRRGIIQAHECFCLCSLEPEYVRHPNWQQGISLATIQDGVLSVEGVLIHQDYLNNNCFAYWREKEYRG